MNKEFKNEFMKLNPQEIKDIINRCAQQDILSKNLYDSFKGNNVDTYTINYIDNDEYGFWNIEWNWKQIYHVNMAFATGLYQNRIKITPFKIEVESASNVSNPFAGQHKRKQLEDYLFIYINKKCSNYKRAIREETEKFIKMLEI